jgi:hypothetical protein
MTLNQEDAQSTLDEIEQHLSLADGTTLQLVLDWFRKQFVQPAEWDLVVMLPTVVAQVNASDFQSKIVDACKQKRAGAKIRGVPNVEALGNDSQVDALCRKYGTKAILIPTVTRFSTKPVRSNVGGLPNVVLVDFGLEVVAAKKGGPLFRQGFPTQVPTNRAFEALDYGSTRAVEKMLAHAGLLGVIELLSSATP